MNRLLRSLSAVTVLVIASPAVFAAEAGQLTVNDRANVFTPEGIQRAKEAFSSTTFQSPTYLTITTAAKVPDSRRTEYEATKGDNAARARFYADWAREMATSDGTRGIFVLVSMEGGRVEAIDDRQTDARRGFGDEKLTTLSRKLSQGFVSATKSKDPAESKRLRDESLLAAVTYAADELKNTSAPEAAAGVNRAADRQDRAAGGLGGGLMGWICIGLCIMLGIWLMVALFRALTGGGGGYGPGGGFGGGGGGFFPSLLGGLFGAAAGMWMYDSFFGGGGEAAAAGNDFSGTDNVDNGAGDYGSGGEGGADFGGDAGGDFGGGDFGGGDFGGGDFGGGDW